ncbi:MAG: tetratricopeptide repeat protein [Bacteroidetes bacterium]|nr:tetratricopeptide repeat protein [Bacteroidota bacterium]
MTRILLLLLLLQLTAFNSYGIHVSEIDSLKQLLVSSKHDTNRVHLLYAISDLSMDENDLLRYAKEAYDLSNRLNFKRGIANASNNIGCAYYNKGDLLPALEFYYKSLAIRTETNDSAGIAQSLNNLATVYERQGNLEKAMEYYLQSLKIRESIKDQNGIAILLNNISLFYKKQGDNRQAIVYAERSLKIRETNGDQFGIAMSLNNLGFIFQDEGDLEKALYYFKRSLSIYTQTGNIQGQALALNNIGWNYDQSGKMDLALSYYLRCIDKLKNTEDKVTRSACFNNISNIYYKKGELEKANKYGNESLQLALGIGVPERIKNASETLSKILSKKGNHKEALEMHQLFKQMSDSMNNVEMRKAAFAKQMQYESEKREKEVALLNKDKELQQKQIALQTFLRNAAILFGILLLIIGFTQYRRAVTNKKYSKILEEKNKIIEQEKEKAIRSEHYKTQFLTNMSHEIRTPMHAIIGMINVLNQRSPRDDQSPYLKVMRKSSESLVGIINNILDISKIEAGKIAFEKRAFSPAETLNTVTNLLHANAIEKGIYLKEENVNLPALVEGDQVRLTQVIINLIGNAIKFTTEGGVTVSAEYMHQHSSDENRCILKFSVIDTGQGIAADKLDKIFESFTQEDEGITRKFGGTGLGLTISKQLVELQGGSIHVESEPGKGTIFSFIIPYGTVASDLNAHETEPEFNTDELKGSRFLIVEDNYYNRIVAKETLSMLIKNPVMHEAENGLVALEKLKETSYDFIFMDIQMPEMDGYTAMKHIREEMPNVLKNAMIIGLSANASEDERDKCMASGMHEYLSKPFNPGDLIRVIMKVKKKASV